MGVFTFTDDGSDAAAMEGTVTSATAGASNVKDTGAGGRGMDDNSLGFMEGRRRDFDRREKDWRGCADMGRRGATGGAGDASAVAACERVSFKDGVYGVGGAATSYMSTGLLVRSQRVAVTGIPVPVGLEPEARGRSGSMASPQQLP